jgi:hypothetical protein
MSTFSARALSSILVALGLANIFLGINTGLGGLETLGWQGDAAFFQVTDEHLYLVRYSHTRFSVLRADVILDPDLTTSLIIELIGMPC